MLKPVHHGEEYDVDVGVYFEWETGRSATPAARQLRDWVQAELLLYADTTPDIKSIVEPPKERCSRALYARQFHIDTPVYHLDPGKDVRRLACQSNDWEASDPKAIYKWFKDIVPESEREQLRRIVRYLKAWAAVSFERDSASRPSSMLLTVVAAQAFATIQFWQLTTLPDDDAVIAVVKAIYERLMNNRRVENPVDKSEDLNRMSHDSWDGFVPKFRALFDAAVAAEDAPDQAVSALTWSQVFSYLMPLPEADELEVVEQASGRALMQVPEIDIEVWSRNPRQLVARHRNEVSAVAKDRDLIFRIANPHILPPYATIEWTVRNAGHEANTIGDLGHRRIGVEMVSAEERTKYAGRHFMDCIVRSQGHVCSMRRIGVFISDLATPPRKSIKPSYTRLRSLVKRHR